MYCFTDVPPLYAEYAEHIDINKWFVGLPTIDKHIDGIRQPEFVLIIAPPNIGKTALIMQMVRYNVRFNPMMKEKLLVWFTPESSEIDLFEREMQNSLKLSSWELEKAFIDNRENLVRICTDKVKLYKNVRLVVGSLHIEQVMDYIMALSEEAGLPVGAVMLDYVQLVEGKTGQQFTDMTQIAKRLKDIAVDLRVPMIVTSQTSRDNARAGTMDAYSAKGSGQLENSAVVILTMQKLREIEPGLIPDDIIQKNIDGDLYIMVMNIEKKKRGRYLKEPLILLQDAKTLQIEELQGEEQLSLLP